MKPLYIFALRALMCLRCRYPICSLLSHTHICSLSLSCALSLAHCRHCALPKLLTTLSHTHRLSLSRSFSPTLFLSHFHARTRALFLARSLVRAFSLTHPLKRRFHRSVALTLARGRPPRIQPSAVGIMSWISK